MRIDVPSNGSKDKRYAREQLRMGMEELKLMARERAGWFSSTSAVVDTMSLPKSDEKDVREALQWTEGVDASKGERCEDRDEKKANIGKSDMHDLHGSTKGKSQLRIKSTNREFMGVKRMTRGTRSRVDSLARESVNVP